MIDWNGKLEAVHTDGRIVPMRLRTDINNPDKDGNYQTEMAPDEMANEWWKSSGESHFDDNWTIRNSIDVNINDYIEWFKSIRFYWKDCQGTQPNSITITGDNLEKLSSIVLNI